MSHGRSEVDGFLARWTQALDDGGTAGGGAIFLDLQAPLVARVRALET